MVNKGTTTILLGFISTLLVAYLGISSTFMWRMDTRAYDITEIQSIQTTILDQQKTILKDHEARLRTVERNTANSRLDLSADGT